MISVPRPTARTRRALLALGTGAAVAVTGGTLVLGALPAGAVTGTQAQSAGFAGGYLARQVTSGGFVADAGGSASPGRTVRAALGLATSGHGRSAFARSIIYLEGQVPAATEDDNGATRPGSTGLLTVDVVAAGRDPRAFGTPTPVDLVARILSTQSTAAGRSNGELLDPTTGYPGVFNHSLAVLGLAAARAPLSDSRVRAAIDFLTRNQCGDGGFQNDPRDTSSTPCTGEDSNTSAYAVQALAAYSAPGVETTALQYFQSIQNSDAGFDSGFSDDSDADSTGLVATALASLGVDPDGPQFSKGTATPASVLRGLQRPRTDEPLDGSYAFLPGPPGQFDDSVLSTQEAVAGQLGTTLPFARVALADDEPRQPVPAAPASSPSRTPASTPSSTPSGTPAPAVVTPAPGTTHPACATVLTPRGRRSAVPAGCVPAPPSMTPCTVVLAPRTFRKGVIPAGCLPLPSAQTPCSVVVDRHARKGVLPRGCLPLFSRS